MSDAQAEDLRSLPKNGISSQHDGLQIEDVHMAVRLQNVT